jgi:hypothetical protein
LYHLPFIWKLYILYRVHHSCYIAVCIFSILNTIQ